ncbi:hypothetical protein FLBR109950_04335 [Flavobacterium branchiophilum]|uniref:Uncharacterized protein n=2 Tax=Flavobacterium branchiophilum TaxID=55197 RepID=G2Z6F8_FLABF|nr:hypothetical protein [Flavobacterium branchiophilum]PDS24226.1 hypothetical protein B0A77_08810 [Flavobacterium branchiophilum]CCB70982.1 Hypothetical protein precursor [Flavobacterium branchiophilum FL-15]
MKKPKLLLSLLLLTAAGTYAQVGVGTTNPQGIFNVDGGKDNASSGTPTTAQQANDLVVLSTGNVGMGTTSPLNKLVVKGTNNQPSAQNVDATNAILRVDGSSNHALDFGVLANSPYGAYIQSQNKTGATGLPLALNPSAGKVGIGTVDPSEALTVITSTNAADFGLFSNVTVPPTSDVMAAQIKLGHSKDWFTGIRSILPSGSANTGLMDLQLTTGTAASDNTQVARLTVKAVSGRVGIGTTTPAQMLDVNGTIRGKYGVLLETQYGTVIENFYAVNGGNNDYVGLIPSGATNNLGILFKASTSGTSGLAEVMRIAPSGNVGIGLLQTNATTATPNAKLDVQSAVKEVARFTSSQTLTNFGHIAIGNATGSWAKLAAGSGAFALRNYSDDSTIIYSDLVTGNTGIGTTDPKTKLEVNGAATNTSSIAATGTTINFALSNLAGTTASAGAFTLQNLKDGGSYTLVVKGATSGTSTFSATNIAGTTLTVHLPSDNGATTASKHTLYNFLVVGTDVYVSWVSGL